MKAMLDNEFDKAFKSSFEDFEVEPSTNSWENIAAKLDEKPKGKKLPVFWLSAAASVVIVLGIGISLYQKPGDDIIRLRKKATPNNEVLSNEQNNELYSKNTPSINNDVIVSGDDKIDNTQSNVINNEAKTANIKSVKKQVIKPSEKNIIPDATITPNENVLVIKNVEEVIAATKPVRKPTVTEKMIAAEEAKKVSLNNNQTALAINNTDVTPSDEGAQSERKLKIKSVGDLVNFVVAKVDKRDEKIIKIGKTEESDTEITGINLGLFKFRKAEK